MSTFSCVAQGFAEQAAGDLLFDEIVEGTALDGRDPKVFIGLADQDDCRIVAG